MGEPERYVGHRATRECGGCGVRVGELCRVTCPELTRQLVGTTWHYRLDYQDRLTVLRVEDGQVWRETGEPYGSVASLFTFRVNTKVARACARPGCIGTYDLTRGECERCLMGEREQREAEAQRAFENGVAVIRYGVDGSVLPVTAEDPAPTTDQRGSPTTLATILQLGLALGDRVWLYRQYGTLHFRAWEEIRLTVLTVAADVGWRLHPDRGPAGVYELPVRTGSDRSVLQALLTGLAEVDPNARVDWYRHGQASRDLHEMAEQFDRLSAARLLYGPAGQFVRFHEDGKVELHTTDGAMMSVGGPDEEPDPPHPDLPADPEPKSPAEWSSIIRKQMTKLERAGVMLPCPPGFAMVGPSSSEPPEAPEQEPDRLLVALRCTATRFAARSEPLSAKAAAAFVRMCRRVEQALVVRAEPSEMNRLLPPDLRKVARWLVLVGSCFTPDGPPPDPEYEHQLMAWLERQVYPLFVVTRV